MKAFVFAYLWHLIFRLIWLVLTLKIIVTDQLHVKYKHTVGQRVSVLCNRSVSVECNDCSVEKRIQARAECAALSPFCTSAL